VIVNLLQFIKSLVAMPTNTYNCSESSVFNSNSWLDEQVINFYRRFQIYRYPWVQYLGAAKHIYEYAVDQVRRRAVKQSND